MPAPEPASSETDKPYVDGETIVIEGLEDGRPMTVKVKEAWDGYFVALTPCCDAGASIGGAGLFYCKGCYEPADPIFADELRRPTSR